MNMFQDTLDKPRRLKGWNNYVWKLKTYLEWIVCCGGETEYAQVNGKEEIQVPVSSDLSITKTCELLAQLPPSSMPLDSGIHAQALITNQYKWSKLNVLKPDRASILEGAIEYVKELQKQVGELAAKLESLNRNGDVDKRFCVGSSEVPEGVIDFLKTQCNILKEQEALISSTTALDNNDKDSIKHENGRSDSNSDRRANEEGPTFHSINYEAERRKRALLNERLYELWTLVPKISSVIVFNKSSILEDAIEYVKELKKQVEELAAELKELNGFHLGSSEVQVEIAQIDDGNEFFVKVFCDHKAGGFVRLMEVLDSLGLEVPNANVTSFRGFVSNVFKVKPKERKIIQADYVKKSLLEVARDPLTDGKMAKA